MKYKVFVVSSCKEMISVCHHIIGLPTKNARFNCNLQGDS